MDSINANGIDKPIAEPFKFLMEYWNDDITDFMVNMMMTMSRINREKTGKGLFEQFMDENRL
ncbi:prophage ps2 protein 16 [Lacticaseibacillus paracasei NRIC 0644]|uniref:Prophage ps2 protein 16 n=1 Tax=Lacticaseibacillus paracasei NRIC 0644 TaxID=1435038 RepID=A0A0C9Q916_LACPA|nr:prophage ps2 protein 16 [Lacticaseibacillus paracasei NRIC 0644]